MVITQLDFHEFYERFRQFTRYHVLITFVAREADAPEEYDEILSSWSSLHDVTGEHVAFVFAGHPLANQTKLAWSTNNRMEAVPDGFLFQTR